MFWYVAILVSKVFKKFIDNLICFAAYHIALLPPFYDGQDYTGIFVLDINYYMYIKNRKNYLMYNTIV